MARFPEQGNRRAFGLAVAGVSGGGEVYFLEHPPWRIADAQSKSAIFLCTQYSPLTLRLLMAHPCATRILSQQRLLLAENALGFFSLWLFCCGGQ